MTNDILVFAEQRDGRLNPVALQCVTPARNLALKTGGNVVACVIGDQVDGPAAVVEEGGVDQVVTVSDPALRLYSALRYRTALKSVIESVKPRLVLMPATFMGRDLAPRVAARLGAGLATDAIDLTLDADGALDVRRPLYNGKAFCHVVFPKDRLAIASVRANTFPPARGQSRPQRTAIAYQPAAGDDRLTTKEVVKASGEAKDVSEADIIVSGGRSLGSEASFKIIYDLAHELDAAVGASRAACDAGYQPHSRQVGLTGKTVTPKLYIACGISGAIQHLAGMRGSKVIVAINKDAEAPIFKVADYGIVDDLFKVVPLLTQEVHKLKAH